MITDPKIEVGDVDYSKLSHTLRFKVAANHNAIQMVEDICGRTDMSMAEVQLVIRKMTYYSTTTVIGIACLGLLALCMIKDTLKE